MCRAFDVSVMRGMHAGADNACHDLSPTGNATMTVTMTMLMIMTMTMTMTMTMNMTMTMTMTMNMTTFAICRCHSHSHIYLCPDKDLAAGFGGVKDHYDSNHQHAWGTLV